MTFKMQRGFAHLKTQMQVAPQKPVRCQVCGDSGFVMVEIGKRWDGVPLTETQKCPACSEGCPTCGGTGVIRYSVPLEDPRFGKLFPCPNPGCTAVQQQQHRQQDMIRKFTELPGNYARFTFASFEALGSEALAGKYEALYAARAFVDAIDVGGWVNLADLAALFGEHADDDSRNWLGFWGEPGYGKTGLAACIVNALTERKIPSLYIRFQDFIEAVQSRYSAESRRGNVGDDFEGMTSEQVIDKVRDARVLVLDELDVPDVTPNKVANMQKVINYRYMKHLPTIYTTNLNPNQYRTRWASDIGNRLKDSCHWFRLTGRELRRDFSMVGE